MKYYLIFKHTGNPHTKSIYPSYIVEHENTAKDFCKEYSEFYYEEREDGIYNFTTKDTAIVTPPQDEVFYENFVPQFDCNPQSKGLYDDIKCPYCGASHFVIGGGMATAMYCPTIIKDGKVVSEDRNIYTQDYECLECGKSFKTVNGKVEK